MSMRCRERAFAALLACCAALPAPAAAHELRVCADPDNLPYSHADETGFENRIARVLAEALGAALAYEWAPQRRGYIRKTLNAGLCDAVMGVPEGYDPVRTTRAYYRSTYVFVQRAQAAPLSGFDDPRLARVKIGVQLVGDDLAATPPGHALVRRGVIDNVVGFPPFGDGPQAERMVRAVARGDIDVAAVWGPPGAYFAAREKRALSVVRARAPAGLDVPFEYAIAVGVRRHDAALQQALDAALAQKRGEIDAILREYRVPRVEGEPRRAGARP